MRHNLNLKLWGVDRMEIRESDNETVTQVSQISHDHTEIMNQIQTNAENVQTALNEAKTLAENLQSLSTNTETHDTIQQLKADIDSLQEKDLKIGTDLNVFQLQYKSFVTEMYKMENQIPSILDQIDFVKSRAHNRDTELQKKLDRLSTRFDFIKENINTLKSQKTPEEILQEQRILTNELVPSNEYEDFKQDIENQFTNISGQIETLTGKQIPKESFDSVISEIETLKTSLRSIESSYEFEELKSDFEDLETTIKDLEVQLANLVSSQEDTANITELEESIGDLETKFQEIQSLKDNLDQIKTGMTNMQSEINGSSQGLEGLKSTVKDLVQLTTLAISEQDITELKEKMAELQTKCQEIQSLATNADKQTTENLKQINSSINQIQSLYENVNNSMTDMHNEIDDNKVKNSESTRELEKLKKLLKELKDQLTASITSQNITQTKLQETSAMAKNADRQTKENLNQISINFQRMNSLYPYIEANKDQITNLQTQIDALESRPDDSKINDLQTEINALKSQPQANKAKINDLQTEINALKSQPQDNKTKINDLQTQLNNLKPQSQNNKTKINDLQSQLDALKPKPDENKAKINDLQSQLDALKSKQNDIQAKGQENSTHIYNLDQKINSLNSKIGTVDDEHMTLIKENQDKIQEVKNLEPLIERNKREIKGHRSIIQLIGQNPEDYEPYKPIKFTTGLDYYQFGISCKLEKVIVYRTRELSYRIQKWSNNGSTLTTIGVGEVVIEPGTACDIFEPNEVILPGNRFTLGPKVKLQKSPSSPPTYIELYISFS